MDHDPSRPDPDALLARFATERRGRLKVFFGFSPGVGKTYAMLDAARRSGRAGVDVVVGVVETHGRVETAALLEGLELLPALEVPYRGTTLAEFDLDGAIARRPQLLLVDELAHSNAPGLRHPKRWQDVVEILDAGIDVHTTLNVQHVESLVDLVEDATGLRVQETVPDLVLDRADEIELVDLPPEELLERLRQGKIFLAEAANRAAERFFRSSNLLQLRDLALRRMALRADADVEADRRRRGEETPAVAAERVLVAVGPGTTGPRIVRAGARIAAGVRADWVAATVEQPGAGLAAGDTQQRLERTHQLAESLGGRVVRLVGSDIPAALLAEARRIGATRLIVGRPRRSRRRVLVGGGVLDRIVRTCGTLDVLVVGDAADEDPAAAPPSDRERSVRGLPVVVASIGAAVTVGRLLAPWFDDHDMSMVALLIVMATAVRYGRPAGIVAVVLGALATNFFFVTPFFSFEVAETKELFSLGLLLSVGLVIGELMARLRAQERIVADREQRTARLLELSRELTRTTTAEGAGGALATAARAITGCGAEVYLPDRVTGALDILKEGERTRRPTADAGVVLWCHEHGRPAGRGTDTLPGAGVTCLPIHHAGRRLGVLAVGWHPPRALSRDRMELLEAAVRQAAVPLAILAGAGRFPPESTVDPPAPA